jgi:ribosomal-protein-alanine N-acetyltransferase
MEEAQVRRAELSDLGEVIAVERSTVGSPHWSEAVWAEVLSAVDDVRRVFVAEHWERVVGFIVVGCAGTLAEIESVAVADDVRRQGLGARLCTEGVDWARQRGATQIELEVRASNEAARRLYGAMGFEEQGTRRGYYADPVEDAVLMGMALRK